MSKDRTFALEELLPATKGSIYKLTLLIAKRALNLADGEKAMVEKPGEKYLQTAVREVAEGKIHEREK